MHERNLMNLTDCRLTTLMDNVIKLEWTVEG